MMTKIVFIISITISSISMAKMTKCQVSIVEHLECLTSNLDSNTSLELETKNRACDSELNTKVKKYHCK